MKAIPVLAAAAVAVLCWLVIRQPAPKSEVTTTAHPVRSGSAPSPVQPQRSVEPSAAAPSIAAPEPAPVVAGPKPTAPPPPADYPALSLAEVLLPGNRFYDAVFGVSLTYPPDWTVRDARRWGRGNGENTVFFNPPPGSQAAPSMYYQNYPEGAPPFDNAQAYLREAALKKELQRSAGGKNDYRNDPDSFVFREVDGRPSMSYFATFTRGDHVMAEYFVRTLGPKGYVMFFVSGPAKDVQNAIPTVHEMAGTVRGP